MSCGPDTTQPRLRRSRLGERRRAWQPLLPVSVVGWVAASLTFIGYAAADAARGNDDAALEARIGLTVGVGTHRGGQLTYLLQ
jgi:hypothetical protein